MKSRFDSIESVIADIRKGKMVIVVDDADRENEGDLIMAAQYVTPAAINFMAKHGRGLICVPTTSERLQQLGMPEDANYGLREHVRAELEFANSIFRDRPGWTVIDVSGRAIEETATIILELFKERDEARAKAAPTTTSA